LSYEALLSEALARVPVHNPEWTNFNDSDPGVTLIQLFAFLTENLLYRSNQIPERNRRKFLNLLGLPLQPGSPAQGLVTFINDRGPLKTQPLADDVEVRAGPIPFRTRSGLDVLPIDWRVVYKQPLADSPADVIATYQQLYAAYGRGAPPTLSLYRTTTLTPPIAPDGKGGVRLASDTLDGSIWIALLMRTADRGRDPDATRAELAGRTVSLGLVPALTEATAKLSPLASHDAQNGGLTLLAFDMPIGGSLGDFADRQPRYRPLPATTTDDLLSEPAVVQITLPPADQLRLWDDVDPLEEGVGDLPPMLDDPVLSNRVITWLRVRLASGSSTPGVGSLRLLSAIPNTVRILQRAHVVAESLGTGRAEPDQVVALARTPVVSGSVRLVVEEQDGPRVWKAVDDLFDSGPEVPVPSPRLPPGTAAPIPLPSRVYVLDPESGQIRFGNGLRGARPPFGARIRADYDYSVGCEGNVAANAIDSGPALPPGFKVTNMLPTWGGTAPESVFEGERQVARYLQHRDRLVTAEDFKTIAQRTPGVDIGRIEVLPTFNPELDPNEPGDVPGAVTLLVIPRFDPVQPAAPRPDRLFLNTVCAYLEPRRPVTTEIFLRGPEYVSIWVSVGIRVDPGASVSVVRERVKQEVAAFLAPLPQTDPRSADIAPGSAPIPQAGWPLNTPVVRLQLATIVGRTAGVFLVNDVLLAADAPTLTPTEQIDMIGLRLPRLAGIAVVPGAPLPLASLRAQTIGPGGAPLPSDGAGGDGTTGGGAGSRPVRPLPVPLIPTECQ
jgi:hypothetical protein